MHLLPHVYPSGPGSREWVLFSDNVEAHLRAELAWPLASGRVSPIIWGRGFRARQASACTQDVPGDHSNLPKAQAPYLQVRGEECLVRLW